MLRKKYDGDISNDDFKNIVIPFEKVTTDFLNNLAYEFIAYYLATGYETNSIWDDALDLHIADCLERFNGITIKSNFNKDYLKTILLSKYHFTIANENPLNMIKMDKI